MPVQHIASMSELQKLANTPRLTVVDAFGSWCGPCKIFAPIFEEFSKKYSSSNFCKFDVDEAGDLAQTLGIRAMPTFVFFKNGKEIDTLEGANASAFEEKLKQHGSSVVFEGQGHRLGDAACNVSSERQQHSQQQQQQHQEPLNDNNTVRRDWPLECPPTETAGKVLLQLPDGTRNPLKIAPNFHKVSDVFKAISQMLEIPVTSFALSVRDGMKTHELNRDDQTNLKEAKVAGGVLLLRKL